MSLIFALLASAIPFAVGSKVGNHGSGLLWTTAALGAALFMSANYGVGFDTAAAMGLGGLGTVAVLVGAPKPGGDAAGTEDEAG